MRADRPCARAAGGEEEREEAIATEVTEEDVDSKK
jgi:hypothetical protein